MKCVISDLAVISVSELCSSDLQLISNASAPYHLAEHDTGRASFFSVPGTDQAVRRHFVLNAETFGLSNQFISLMLELSDFGIPYVRFERGNHTFVDL